MNAHQHDGHTRREPSGELVAAGPAVDGELIEDGTRGELLPSSTSGVKLWRHSARVPHWLKSRAHARQAAKDGVVWMLRWPWRLLRSAVRGAIAAVRAWRNWVRVHDYRDSAERAEKLADKYMEIRALTLFRWKVTGAVAVCGGVGLYIAEAVFGPRALWAVAGAAGIALVVLGRRKDGAPGRRAVLAGPRALMWTMDPQVLVDAFRDAKLIGKDEMLRLVERAHRQGAGWAITVDLPATRKAADVIKNRDALASALAVDEVQLSVERVRGRGGHAGRVALWVADDDPYAAAPIPTPLLRVQQWDAWRPVPFGRDARNQRIELPLVWTSLLVGAIPRQGKTFAARLAAAGLILDPHTQLYVFDGKGGKDWKAAEAIAYRFVCGDDIEHAEAVRDGLIELVAETQARFARMSELDDDVCPESKITPAISRDRSLGMPITGVIIDEVQVFLENPTKQDLGGRKTTMGDYIADLLTYLAKKGPAAGIIVILATQRPDSNTIPSRLRAVLGSRLAMRVMDWRDSNIILGEQMNTRGYDSSKLQPSHKGVGILRPDGETDAGIDALATTVRTYYMPNPDWRAICQRGRALRESVGTLAGHAAGERPAVAVDASAVLRALGPTVEADPGSGSIQLPEPLASVVSYLGPDLDEDGREFVPTTELVEALAVEPTSFGKQMGDLGCGPKPRRFTGIDGTARQVRGYLTADMRAAVERHRDHGHPSP